MFSTNLSWSWMLRIKITWCCMTPTDVTSVAEKLELYIWFVIRSRLRRRMRFGMIGRWWERYQDWQMMMLGTKASWREISRFSERITFGRKGTCRETSGINRRMRFQTKVPLNELDIECQFDGGIRFNCACRFRKGNRFSTNGLWSK